MYGVSQSCTLHTSVVVGVRTIPDITGSKSLIYGVSQSCTIHTSVVVGVRTIPDITVSHSCTG